MFYAQYSCNKLELVITIKVAIFKLKETLHHTFHTDTLHINVILINMLLYCIDFI